MRRIEIIAHRGNFVPEGPIPITQNKYRIPENTKAAFTRAFQKGWGVETDIRVAGDGNFVVIHDGDLVRFAGSQGIIDQMSVDQIKQVGFKSNPQFKVPTLDELCHLANGSFIAFQIKRGHSPESGVKVGRAVAQKMEQYNLKDSILFDATLEEAEILIEEFPWLNLSVSVGEENYSPTIYTPSQVFTAKFMKAFNCIWADEWKISGSIYNEELFKKMRAAYEGRIDVISPELHYNENHPLSKNLAKVKSLWQRIISWGIVNGICTDYPTQLKSFCI